MNRRVFLILILGILSVFILFAYYISGIMKTMNSNTDGDLARDSSYIPKNYSSLFKDVSNLDFKTTTVSKTRNPITEFEYKDKYHLCLYQVSLTSYKFSLNKNLIERNYEEHTTYHLTYYVINNSKVFELLYKSGSQEVGPNIYLNVFGDGLVAIKKNDTIAYYNTKFKNFYIKYQSEGPNDFYGGVKDDYNAIKVPSEILFIKRDGNLYLMILYPDKNNDDIKPGTLLQLIKT